MVDRLLSLARRLASLVDAAEDLERLADVPLNIVCFRYRPPGMSSDRLDEINKQLAERLIDDGRIYVGGTIYEDKRALRPAIVNWRTTESDIDVIVEVVRELGSGLVSDT
jgi:glutamate/tyrosine decarboxylase-like PLP-dependent enzyme